jgi:hypothetical protein
MKNKTCIIVGAVVLGALALFYFSLRQSHPGERSVWGSLGTTENKSTQVVIATLLDPALTTEGKTSPEFDSLNQLYSEKVLGKNNLILNHRIISHWWAAGKNQLAFLIVLREMDDLFPANLMNDSLFQAAWPTKVEQDKFRELYDKYFVGKRPGEIEGESPDTTAT